MHATIDDLQPDGKGAMLMVRFGGAVFDRLVHLTNELMPRLDSRLPCV